jgi:hypothetical protein
VALDEADHRRAELGEPLARIDLRLSDRAW